MKLFGFACSGHTYFKKHRNTELYYAFILEVFKWLMMIMFQVDLTPFGFLVPLFLLCVKKKACKKVRRNVIQSNISVYLSLSTFVVLQSKVKKVDAIFYGYVNIAGKGTLTGSGSFLEKKLSCFWNSMQKSQSSRGNCISKIYKNTQFIHSCISVPQSKVKQNQCIKFLFRDQFFIEMR